jgi:hypothetical protein
MNRILTFAEFAKSFNDKGTELGNSPADVAALAKSTEQFTADGGNTGSDSEADTDTPDVVDGGGEKVIALAVQPDGEGDDPEEDDDDEDEENEPEEEDEEGDGELGA